MNSKKAQQIEECILIVSKHFGADPMRVLTSFNVANKAVTNARSLLWFHFHACGMSYNSIGRIFTLSDEYITRRARQGMLRLSDEDRLILNDLPKIESRLVICSADGHTNPKFPR